MTTEVVTTVYPSFVEKDWDKFCDLILQSDGNKFYVHKAVISMWSPKLKAQIIKMPSSTEEGSLCEIDIGTYDKALLLVLLQTIYPPNKPLDITNVKSLVALSRDLVIPELSRRCEDFLLTESTLSLELLIFAQETSLKRLLAKCLDFCSRNSLDTLKRNTSYKLIQTPILSSLLELRCKRTEKKLKRSEMRCWELECALRAIRDSWYKKEGACLNHRQTGETQDNCAECLHAIRRQIGNMCELALDSPEEHSE